MRSRILALLATAALATGGLAVSSCGSDGDDGRVDIAQSARATAAKETARMTMQMRVSGLGLPQPLTLRAKGVTALGEPRARLSMDLEPFLTLLGAPSEGGRQLELLIDGAEVYAKPPRIEGLTVPGGKPWVALDLKAVAEAADLPTEGLGALFNIDPASQLRALKAAKGLEEVGKEEVDGAETTHLKGTYRLSDLIAGLPAEKRVGARRALRELERLGGGQSSPGLDEPIPADFWIDQDGVARRTRVTSKLPGQAGAPSGSFSVTYALRDFGVKLDASAPGTSERYDATEDVQGAVRALAKARK